MNTSYERASVANLYEYTRNKLSADLPYSNFQKLLAYPFDKVYQQLEVEPDAQEL
jgi:hypothetical protein